MILKQLVMFLLLFAETLAADEKRVQYAVRLETAETAEIASRVHVSMTLPDELSGPRTLIVPRAIPMGYGLQGYDEFVSNVAAFDPEGKPLTVTRAEGPRWSLGTEKTTLRRVEYDVDIAEMEKNILSSGDSSRARPEYLFLLGYSVFAYVEGLENRAIELMVAGPGRSPRFTTLPGNVDTTWTSSAMAESFYALADSQVVVGSNAKILTEELPRKADEAAPLQFRTVAYAEGELDFARLNREAKETFQKVKAYFGTRPFSQYSVIFEYLNLPSARHRAGFSMEHLQSATFCLDAKTIPKTEQDWARTRYNIAHHIAHAWIPKRAYGKGYFPFPWEAPPMIDTIWFSEGFAQYAAADALADALPEAERDAYRQRMVEARFRTLREMPAFLKQMPLVELSYLASTQYSEDFRIGRTVFSRGGLMAYEMDRRIREQTKGAKRLRDALRHLVAWSAKNQRAFKIEELPLIFKEATGVETRDILEKWLAPM
jgi:predicted metalloprotease with PDZ domain